MKRAIGSMMLDPVATQHDSWIKCAIWFEERVTEIRQWLIKEATDYSSANTTSAKDWVRTNAADIHVEGVFVEHFSATLVKVYHALEEQSMPTPGDEVMRLVS